jgi:hypothetical protein
MKDTSLVSPTRLRLVEALCSDHRLTGNGYGQMNGWHSSVVIRGVSLRVLLAVG